MPHSSPTAGNDGGGEDELAALRRKIDRLERRLAEVENYSGDCPDHDETDRRLRGCELEIDRLIPLVDLHSSEIESVEIAVKALTTRKGRRA